MDLNLYPKCEEDEKDEKISLNVKYFIISIYMKVNILEDDFYGFYKTITDYETIADIMDMNYSNPKRLRQEIRKLLNDAEKTGYISYTILPENQDIEIVALIPEPKAKTKNKNEIYTCFPYDFMSLEYIKFINDRGLEETKVMTKDLKMYFMALFRYGYHKGICKASNEQIAKSSGLSIRKVQMLHKEAQRIGLIGKYEPSKGGYSYVTDKETGEKIRIGKMSVIPLVNEETERYYFEDLLPRKKKIKKLIPKKKAQ